MRIGGLMRDITDPLKIHLVLKVGRNWHWISGGVGKRYWMGKDMGLEQWVSDLDWKFCGPLDWSGVLGVENGVVGLIEYGWGWIDTELGLDMNKALK